MKKVMNILLGILMVITIVLLVYAIATRGSEAAISVNLIWCYVLIVAAIAAALFCAVFGMTQNPAGIKGTLLSFGLIVAIVGIAYFISASHSVQIPDLANNSVFDRGATVLTETSILVTYVAIVAAIVTTVVTEIWGALK